MSISHCSLRLNILMVVWPNGEMVQASPKRTTCSRIGTQCHSTPVPLPLPFHSFLVRLARSLDEETTELPNHNAQNPNGSRQQHEHPVALHVSASHAETSIAVSGSDPTQGTYFQKLSAVNSMWSSKMLSIDRPYIFMVFFIIYTREANRVRHPKSHGCAG